jgi:serine/threonine protein phosphatase PrpC
MSNDYEILKTKFSNFQKFLGTIGDADKVAKFSKLSHDQWLVLASANITPYLKSNTMDHAVTEMCDQLGIDKTIDENIDKLKRYLNCFAEYLSQDNMQEVVQEKAKEIEPIDDEDDPYLKMLSGISM